LAVAEALEAHDEVIPLAELRAGALELERHVEGWCTRA
jgi:hypothetical protein